MIITNAVLVKWGNQVLQDLIFKRNGYVRDAYSLGCSYKAINTHVHKATSWPGYMEIGNVMLIAIVLQHISSCSSGFRVQGAPK